MREAELIVVGGGPAGLFGALRAAEAGARVLLLEKMRRPGTKLLASGSGRCNFSHAGPVEDFLGHYGKAGRFLKPALLGFTNADLAAFLQSRGLAVLEEEGGKLFPASGRAGDILELLLRELGRLGVELRTDCAVRGAALSGGRFVVEAAGGPWEAPALLLATGGLSYPGTGSSGDGYALAAAFGHAIAQTAPCLAPVAVEGWAFAACAGIALRGAPLELRRGEGGKLAARGRGDVLFTHRGLSGPGILDLSRSILPGDELRVRLASGEGDPDELLLAELGAHGKRGLKSCVQALGLPERLAQALLAGLGIEPSTPAALLGREARKRVSAALAGFPFRVASLGGYGEAMATRGGVALEEVDPKSMGSRLVSGLYFAGELLDIDGDTGGYNIQAACSTGALAGSHAAAR
ncbi:MAG TPA: NAD(P)/FAD-dependent oxidoreductase [Spirochaetales bacterium]|nr:NAD(P)/FAD-dependent oxidoreductase [Spirochaetales bacterium]HRY54444.1 NAD(P)/FAD-dependent oxidoreductase [Spirochaetia bacterium]HRZ63747.1 NAD(P)/FAD-dependent oxidoreductase [Spirochaetia bacterium]